MPSLKTFKSKDALADAAAEHLASVLGKALDEKGRASAVLSGGSSPKPVYERLANKPLAWEGVGLSLVDERWVPSGAKGSNFDFLRECVADTPAARAKLVPLFNGHGSAAEGVEAAEQALALIVPPFDLCVLGMGLDGHTASWFPNSGGLEAALNPSNSARLCAIDATGCPVAGDLTDRITLTFSAVAAARETVLLLPSAEKLAVYKAALEKDPKDAPVAALSGLGDKLTVYGLEET
jgi:6-phosphogluconolactonase